MSAPAVPSALEMTKKYFLSPQTKVSDLSGGLGWSGFRTVQVLRNGASGFAEGTSGGSERERSRGRGREVMFLEHPLCAHNPPNSYAMENGFWFYMHKETEAQRGQSQVLGLLRGGGGRILSPARLRARPLFIVPGA